MKRPELMIMNGTLAGQRFEVKDGGLRLGRSSSNDIHVPDEELSRNHCLFETVGESGVRVSGLRRKPLRRPDIAAPRSPMSSGSSPCWSRAGRST